MICATLANRHTDRQFWRVILLAQPFELIAVILLYCSLVLDWCDFFNVYQCVPSSGLLSSIFCVFQLYTGPNRPVHQVDKWNAWFFEDLSVLVSAAVVTDQSVCQLFNRQVVRYYEILRNVRDVFMAKDRVIGLQLALSVFIVLVFSWLLAFWLTVYLPIHGLVVIFL